MVDFYKSVFLKDDADTYAELMPPKFKQAKNPGRYYNDWRTHQMSDHLLLRVELKINYDREYLGGLSNDPQRIVTESVGLP